MSIARNALDPLKFNRLVVLPYELRLEDFRLAVQDVYDFFFDLVDWKLIPIDNWLSLQRPQSKVREL